MSTYWERIPKDDGQRARLADGTSGHQAAVRRGVFGLPHFLEHLMFKGSRGRDIDMARGFLGWQFPGARLWRQVILLADRLEGVHGEARATKDRIVARVPGWVWEAPELIEFGGRVAISTLGLGVLAWCAWALSLIEAAGDDLEAVFGLTIAALISGGIGLWMLVAPWPDPDPPACLVRQANRIIAWLWRRARTTAFGKWIVMTEEPPVLRPLPIMALPPETGGLSDRRGTRKGWVLIVLGAAMVAAGWWLAEADRHGALFGQWGNAVGTALMLGFVLTIVAGASLAWQGWVLTGAVVGTRLMLGGAAAILFGVALSGVVIAGLVDALGSAAVEGDGDNGIWIKAWFAGLFVVAGCDIAAGGLRMWREALAMPAAGEKK